MIEPHRRESESHGSINELEDIVVSHFLLLMVRIVKGTMSVSILVLHGRIKVFKL